MVTIGIYVVIFAVLGISIFKGKQRGFVGTLVGMSAFIIAIIVALSFGAKVGDYIDKNTSFREHTNQFIYEEFGMETGVSYTESDEEQKELMKNTFANVIFEGNYDEIEQEEKGDSYVEKATNFMTDKAVMALGYLIVFIATYIVLKIVLLLTKVLRRIPILGPIDEALGALIGFVRGILVIWLLFIIVTTFSSFDACQYVINSITASKFLSFLYKIPLSFLN